MGMGAFKSPTVGVLLASALAAGIIGFTMSRRASRREKISAIGSMAVLGRARDLGDTEIARAGREFINERVVPEMKPVLIDLLKEFEGYLDGYFKQAEKALKAM
jgi:hypothetical protein